MSATGSCWRRAHVPRRDCFCFCLHCRVWCERSGATCELTPLRASRAPCTEAARSCLSGEAVAEGSVPRAGAPESTWRGSHSPRTRTRCRRSRCFVVGQVPVRRLLGDLLNTTTWPEVLRRFASAQMRYSRALFSRHGQEGWPGEGHPLATAIEVLSFYSVMLYQWQRRFPKIICSTSNGNLWTFKL